MYVIVSTNIHVHVTIMIIIICIFLFFALALYFSLLFCTKSIIITVKFHLKINLFSRA